jgi:hypothetical protein
LFAHVKHRCINWNPLNFRKDSPALTEAGGDLTGDFETERKNDAMIVQKAFSTSDKVLLMLSCFYRGHIFIVPHWIYFTSFRTHWRHLSRPHTRIFQKW